jgi:hypothetical protein
MEYYNKYLKYKTKYNELKNKNIIGGAIISRNYYLHIRLSKEIEEKFNLVKTSLDRYNIKKDPMPAHITISYGPTIEYDDINNMMDYEINDVREIETIYPDFLKNFKDMVPDIIYNGITVFLRPDQIVIKAEIISDVLSKMDNFCRKNIISYNHIVKKWKEEYDSVKEEIRLKFPILFKEEESFDEENPKGQLHITLITLNYDTPESTIIDIIKYAEAELSKVGINKGTHFYADRIDLKTPFSRRFINVLKY